MNQQLFNDEEFVKMSDKDLVQKLSKNHSFFERGRALIQLARRSGHNEKDLEFVIAQIQDPDNMDARTVGVVSIAHLGVGGLLEANTSLTINAVKKILAQWPEGDCSNLLWFLESGSLTRNLL